jgi:hypothetical protein
MNPIAAYRSGSAMLGVQNPLGNPGVYSLVQPIQRYIGTDAGWEQQAVNLAADPARTVSLVADPDDEFNIPAGWKGMITLRFVGGVTDVSSVVVTTTIVDWTGFQEFTRDDDLLEVGYVNNVGANTMDFAMTTGTTVPAIITFVYGDLGSSLTV